MGSKHFYGIDWIRGIAAVGIVGCHLDLSGMTAGALWLKRFTDLNVGVFAVIAGFFAVGSMVRSVSWGEFVRRKCGRLLLPYVCFTVFYVSIDYVFDALTGATHTFQPLSGSYWESVVFRGGGAAHLWFLIALFYAQAVFYPIVRWGRHLPIALVTGGGMAIGLAIVAVCPRVGGFVGFYLLRLVGFFAMGASLWFARGWLCELPVRWALLACGGGVAIIAVWGKLSFVWESVLILPMVVLGLCWQPATERVRQVGAYLGGLSFGVYLMHVVFAIALREAVKMLGLHGTAWVYAGVWLFAGGLTIGAVICVRWVSWRWPLVNAVVPVR